MTTSTPTGNQGGESADTINLSGMGYHFSGAGLSLLQHGADAYCLAVAAIDVSGSQSGEEQNLADCFANVLAACDKAPNRDAILFRLTEFNSQVRELRGFVPPANALRPTFTTGGYTAIGAACLDAIRSIETYAEHLLSNGDYQSNGIFFVLTDGEETVESAPAGLSYDEELNYRIDAASAKVKAEIDRVQKSEKLNSIIPILVGFRPNPETEARQRRFATNAGMLYVKLADATPQRLAKFAHFVSQSTSSQSRQAGSRQAATITVPQDLDPTASLSI